MVQKANWVRRQVLEMIVSAGKGHIGGSLSCVDILVALYYGGILKEKDKFILSKGHACAALYAILADLGFFSLEELAKFNQAGSMLAGHPNRTIPGVLVDSGSLGHGLGIGAGLALSARDSIVYVLMSDGECHEGSVWEAAMFASHHKLNNLVGIIDKNRMCSIDYIDDCMKIEPLASKWRSFGWETFTVKGHSYSDLMSGFSIVRQAQSFINKPFMVIAETVKGKGIPFMEWNLEWHHGVPKGVQLEIARKELGGIER